MSNLQWISVIIYVVNLINIVIVQCEPNDTIIVFSALNNLDSGTSGRSVVAAQWLALQQLNNDNNSLLSNYYHFKLDRYDAAGDSGIALTEALQIIQKSTSTSTTCSSSSNNDNINNNDSVILYFPIILGCPWSSLSTVTSPVFGAFNMGQISSGATSVALSDSNRYPQFYRTIPSDSLQAQGIVLLCDYFNWSSIAIVYVNDAYGLYLSIGILDLSTKYNITATSISFANDEPSTLEQAAKQVKHLNVFIIIFIVHDTQLTIAFDKFNKQNLTGYPYFYIGVDSWFDQTIIAQQNVTHYSQGFIGTVPWQTLSLDLDQYDDELRPIINQSMQKYDELNNLWKQYYDTNLYNKELNDLSYQGDNAFGALAIYGYDSIHTLISALDRYLNQTDDFELLNVTNNIELLNDIILETDFIGLSGHISFDENGDRLNGLYSLGFAEENGNVNYFGYFFDDNGTLKINVEYDKIKWPSYFVERGMEPRSSVLIIDDVQTIAQYISTPLFILSFISMFIAFLYFVFTLKYRTSPILKASSWKINLIMCFGAIFGYITMIIYGIDEISVKSLQLFTFVCNLRLWMWTISYTLLFMPLFMKTYRLSRIFNQVLNKKFLPDSKLLYVILICVFIDILLLTIYTAIEPLSRMYISGKFEVIDELQTFHHLYGSCETSSKTVSFAFYGLIALWKICQTLFGIYCAISVSRIGHKKLIQFDETSQQLLSILFTIISLCIAAPILAFGPNDIPSFFYAVIGYLTLTVGNITLSLNMFPRIYFIMKNNNNDNDNNKMRLSRYTQSAEDKLQDLIIEQLRRIGIDDKWWQKASTVDKTNEVYRVHSNTQQNRGSFISSKMDNSSNTLQLTALDTPREQEEDENNDDAGTDSDMAEQNDRKLTKKLETISKNNKKQNLLTQHINYNNDKNGVE